MTFSPQQQQILAIAAARKRMAETAPVDAEQPPQAAPQSGMDTLNGAAQDVAQGATMGWGQTIGHGIANAGGFQWTVPEGIRQAGYLAGRGANAVENLFDAGNPNPPSYEDYAANLAGNKKTVTQPMQQFNDEHPWYGGALQVAGGLASGGAIGKMVGSAAPRLTNALQTFAKANPYTAAAGIGAGTGAVYGAGASDEGLANTAKGAAFGGVGGAVGGLAATAVGRNIIGPIASKVDNAYQGSALQKFLQNSESGALPAAEAETAPATISDLQKPNGEYFSKTAGEKTQSSKLQTLEADATGGRYGDTPRAMMANARSAQNQERAAFVNALHPDATDTTSVNDVLDGIYNRVNTQAQNLGKQVDNAYNVARQGNSVKVNADDITSGLLGNIGKIRQEMAVNLSDKTNYSKANAALDALAEKLDAAKGSKITSVKLGDLEDWRKTLSNYTNDAQGTEKAFLGKTLAAYDDFMINTANHAVDIGDKDAIMAFRNAVGLRRQYGQMFQKNDIVEAIANGKGPDEFAKSIIGSGSIGGRRGMMDNVKALVTAGGNDADAVKQDLGAAFAKRLFARASNGFEEGKPDTAFISPAKMASGLDELFVKNKELGSYLFGEDATKAAQKAISELKVIASKQPGTQNPSGSGYMIARVLRDTGITKIPVFSKIPLANEIVGSISRARGTSATQKALQDFVTAQTAPKSALFSAVGGLAGGTSSGAIVNNTKKEAKQ